MAASSRRSRRHCGACGRAASVASSSLPVRTPLRLGLPCIRLPRQPPTRSLSPLPQTVVVGAAAAGAGVGVGARAVGVYSVNPSCVVRILVPWLCVHSYPQRKQTDLPRVCTGPLSYPYMKDGTQSSKAIGPHPSSFSGQRALDFVLKNNGNIDKSLLFDIELLELSAVGAARRGPGRVVAGVGSAGARPNGLYDK